MICKKCDTSNGDDAKYCMHCGADLEEQKSQKVKKKNKKEASQGLASFCFFPYSDLRIKSM